MFGSSLHLSEGAKIERPSLSAVSLKRCWKWMKFSRSLTAAIPGRHREHAGENSNAAGRGNRITCFQLFPLDSMFSRVFQTQNESQHIVSLSHCNSTCKQIFSAEQALRKDWSKQQRWIENENYELHRKLGKQFKILCKEIDFKAP